MARPRGWDLHAVFAGAIICWAVIEGGAFAQDGAELTEDLGNSYLLARRTTAHGSIIETLLFAGQAIVTEIAVPAPDAGMTAGIPGVIARTAAGNANAPPDGAAALPPGMGPGFGGTWLTGDIIDEYLVLHRTRASGPVMHEIFRQGHKVGSVTEVGPSIRTTRLAAQNSFAFEFADDRFIVRMTQPDGTIIRATTEHGRFLGQAVERAAAVAVQPRSGVAAHAEPPPEAVGPSIGRSPEPQRLVRPQEPAGRIMVEEPAPRVIPSLPEAVPLPRPFPLRRLTPAIGATPVQTASPSPAGNLYRSPPESMTVAPTIRPKPTITSVNAPRSAAAARPVGPASTITAPATRPKPAVTSVNAPPPPAAPGARSVTPTNAAPPAGPRPAAAIATEPPAAAKPIVRAPASAGPAVKPKPTALTESSRPPTGRAAKPVPPVARPLRSPRPDTLGK
jgi:hypothetical protein